VVGLLVGVVSGVLNGALNEGGPPVVMFLALKPWGKDDVKATLQFYFMLICVFSVAMLAQKGILAPRHLYYDAVGLPAGALGLGLGVALYSRLDQKVFGRVVIGALLLAGVTYIAHAATALLASRLR